VGVKIANIYYPYFFIAMDSRIVWLEPLVILLCLERVQIKDILAQGLIEVFHILDNRKYTSTLHTYNTFL